MERREIILGNGVHFAPLAGVADAPVRVLARLFGAGPTMSEMLSAHGIGDSGRVRLLDEQLVLQEMEQPLAVQLVGSDPGMMADVAQLAIERGAASINLNMACPARKITKGGKGSALMRDPEQAARIMRRVRDRVKAPVTLKIRAGWNHVSRNAVDFSRLAEDCGMEAIFLHPRTREQFFKGRADWGLIKETVDAVSIPVVGNGDIKSGEDARRMFEETGCAGVMVGRGALGRPWLFTRILEALEDTGRIAPATHAVPDIEALGFAPFDVAALEAGDGTQRARLVHLHVALGARMKSEERVALEVRKHMLWYSRGLPGAARFRSRIHTVVDVATLTRLTDEFFVGIND